MTHTQEVHITKSSRDWSVHTIQHWQGWPNPAETHSPTYSLTWAIYYAAYWAAENDTAIVELTIRGKPCHPALARSAIMKHTTGVLHYDRKPCMAAIATLA